MALIHSSIMPVARAADLPDTAEPQLLVVAPEPVVSSPAVKAQK